MTGELTIGGAPNFAQSFQSYANKVNLLDSMGDYSINGSGMDSDLGLSSLGMNSSVFGSGYGFGYSQKEQAMRSSMSDSEYAIYRAQEQEKMDDFMLGRQVRQQKKAAAALFATTAQEDVTTRQAGLLSEQIRDNKQDSVSETYGNFKNAAREQLAEAGYTNVPEAQLNAYAEKLYYQATGARITDSLKANGQDEFLHGLIQGTGIGCLFVPRKTAGDNIAEITGEPKSTSEGVAKWAGRILGAAATLVALPFVLRGGKNAVKGLFGLTKNSWAKLAGKEIDEVVEVGTKGAKGAKKVAKTVVKK